MKNNKFTNLMHEEIARRKDDHRWDSLIAEKVTTRRNKTKRTLAYSLSFSSLAAAAVLVLIITSGITGNGSDDRYNTFISSQVEGTYDVVFNGSRSSEDSDGEEDIIELDDIDSVIVSSLSI